MLCHIYRCSRQDEMYLYVPSGTSRNELPENLRAMTGTLFFVMELELTPERRLARADVATVLATIDRQGFYLQMPPNLDPFLHFGD